MAKDRPGPKKDCPNKDGSGKGGRNPYGRRQPKQGQGRGRNRR